MNIVEIYLQPERYNPRVRATIPGAWMAVRSDGSEYPVGASYSFSNAEQALEYINNLNAMRGN
jgi:hypothetical protein